MPLSDHFRPPVWTHSSWEGFHGGWPMTMVQQLARKLPPEFSAEPRVHLGDYFEIDVCAYEENQNERGAATHVSGCETGALEIFTCPPPNPRGGVEANRGDQVINRVFFYV